MAYGVVTGDRLAFEKKKIKSMSNTTIGQSGDLAMNNAGAMSIHTVTYGHDNQNRLKFLCGVSYCDGGSVCTG